VLRAFGCFRISLFILIFAMQASALGWVHLELGAGNYGQRSLYTLFRKQSNYEILFKTARKLALTNQGPGLMIINDIHPGWAHVAARALETYVREEKLAIEVGVLAGDATKIEIPEVDAIYIQNPSLYFLNALGAPGIIAKLNSRSRTGLVINTGYLYLDEFAPAFAPLLRDNHFRIVTNPLREYVYPGGRREGSSYRIHFEVAANNVAVDETAIRQLPNLRRPTMPHHSWNPCEWASRIAIAFRR